MPKHYRIGVLPGDGIGPEVVGAGLKVLDAAQKRYKFELEYVHGDAGTNCMERYKTNLPQQTIKMLKKTDACLKGPMTTLSDPKAPRSVAVTLRKLFDLHANIRPCVSYPNVPALKENVDLIIVRENTEGLYSGIERRIGPGKAVASRIITKKATEKVAVTALELAKGRKKQLTIVHKANILRVTDGLFRDSVYNVAKKYRVRVNEMHVDAFAMALLRKPEIFDVCVMENMYGDILSDEAAQLVGGLGMVPGANIGKKWAMFEPVHGSAPKYKNMNKVNPIATILAGKMMLEYLGEKKAAEGIGKAVKAVLKEGRFRTYDIGGTNSTSQVADAIAQKVLKMNGKH